MTDARDLQQEWAFKSRVVVGVIDDVNEARGTVRVIVHNYRTAQTANLPLGALNYGGGAAPSSWQRHMPEVGSHVRCAWTPQGRLEVLGYTAYGSDANETAPGTGGYATLTALSNSAPGDTGLRAWRRLARGEFDLRSSGGAGYFFSKLGHAMLEAGDLALVLDKTARSGVIDGPELFGWTGAESSQVLGTIRRYASGVSIPVVASAGAVEGLQREWTVEVAARTAATVPPYGEPVPLYSHAYGDVRDAVALPVLGGPTPSPGLPLRSRQRWYDATGTQTTLTVEVDATGGVLVTQGVAAAAGGVKLVASASPVAVEALSIGLSTTARLNLNAGGTADGSIMKAEGLLAWMQTQLSVQTAFGPSGPLVPGITFTPGTEHSILAKVK